jgi:hypothetical protein
VDDDRAQPDTPDQIWNVAVAESVVRVVDRGIVVAFVMVVGSVASRIGVMAAVDTLVPMTDPITPSGAAAIVEQAWNAWLNRNESRIVSLISAAAPVDTGQLRSSHVATRRPGGPSGTTVLRVTARAPHSGWVVSGTRPHEIRARSGGVLSWLDRLTGARRFATVVRHPGTRPNPYMIRALSRAGFTTRST